MGVGKRPVLHLLRLSRGLSITEQLWIEEALLRHDKRNWCLMKGGEPVGAPPTIVLGIGGQPHKLVNQELARLAGIPMVRRFSGGGTVIVDQDSLFVTFIMNSEQVTPGEPFPRPIMQWTASIYKPVFARLAPPDKAAFELRENDYVFGHLKFGGNAQSIVKDRWLHHTSFLWDYREEDMAYLQIPEKKPDYRGSRGHGAFLTRLKEGLAEGKDREALFDEVEVELSRHFTVTTAHGTAGHEVVEERLGGMDKWAKQGARTRDVPHLPPPPAVAAGESDVVGGGGDSTIAQQAGGGVTIKVP